jgi:hypothetical protein
VRAGVDSGTSNSEMSLSPATTNADAASSFSDEQEIPVRVNP